jgi:hypothetical protein
MKTELLLTPNNELQEIGKQIKLLKKQTVENIINIGNHLISAKEYCKHGEWLNFLENNVKINERTAQNFMRVAKEYDSNTYLDSDLNQSKIFKLLGIEKKKRQEFIETEHNVNGEFKKVKEMTNAELNKAIKQYKNLEDKLKTKNNEIKDIKEDIYKRNALDGVSVEFDEILSEGILHQSLYYKIYIVRDGVKQLIKDNNFNYFYFIKDNDWNKWNEYMKNQIYGIETLTKEETDFIYGQYLIFCESGVCANRFKELEKEWEDNNAKSKKKFTDDFSEKFNDILFPKRAEESEDTKAILKKFYITLAKTYHPDKGGSDAEMQLLNKLKLDWEINK